MERLAAWEANGSGVGVLKVALPEDSRDRLRSRSLYFHASVNLAAGGTLSNAAPWSATVDVHHLPASQRKRLVVKAFFDVISHIDTNYEELFELDIHVAPYYKNAVAWPLVSLSTGPCHTLVVGGACLVVSFLKDACNVEFREDGTVYRKIHSPGIKTLTLCVHAVTEPIREAFEECARLKRVHGDQAIAPAILIRLPPIYEAGSRRARLDAWAESLADVTEITFEFVHCACCGNLTREDMQHQVLHR